MATPPRKIRALPGGETVKIVAVTASVLAEEEREIMAAGCDEVVRKPFRNNEIFEAMARQLGVTYRYKTEGVTPTQRQTQALTAEMLAALPPESLHDLREATLALNREAASAAIEPLADLEPEVADGLRELVDNFQMGRLQELLAESDEIHG